MYLSVQDRNRLDMILGETGISDDIEAWARAYLDTGLHAEDWEVQRAVQRQMALDTYDASLD
jgi:hypothetical protein